MKKMKDRYANLQLCPRKRSPWEIVRSIVMLGQGLCLFKLFEFVLLQYMKYKQIVLLLMCSFISPYEGNLRTSFTPSYPNKLWIEEQAFCNAFPFHIVFDQDVRDFFTRIMI